MSTLYKHQVAIDSQRLINLYAMYVEISAENVFLGSKAVCLASRLARPRLSDQNDSKELRSLRRRWIYSSVLQFAYNGAMVQKMIRDDKTLSEAQSRWVEIISFLEYGLDTSTMVR